MTIAYLTSGAAGMYCGSCMHDNSLAKAFLALGKDCLLIPTYTPIRTDESDASVDKVFFGGINVFLQQKMPWLAYLPRWLDSALNRPKLIRWLTSGAMQTDPKFLAALTVSMLHGMEGNQRKEVLRLADWLATSVRPTALIFSNLLIAGCIPEFKRRLKTPIAVTLQGDDIFFESLPAPFRDQAVQAMQKLVPLVDHFLIHSRDYSDRMSKVLQIPDAQIRIIPLGIDTADFRSIDWHEPSDQFRIGYLARMAPEKGLHHLVDSFVELHSRKPGIAARLELAGWMGPQHVSYWKCQEEKLAKAGLNEYYTYHGSVDRLGKLRFLADIDLLCVPTEYQEPKGLFVLEAVAAGIRYLLPNHGAFPELHQRLNYGSLYEAGNGQRLIEGLQNAIDQGASDIPERKRARDTRIDEIDISRHATRLIEAINLH